MTPQRSAFEELYDADSEDPSMAQQFEDFCKGYAAGAAAQAERDARDAERYRWLREKCPIALMNAAVKYAGKVLTGFAAPLAVYEATTPDSAIDAAIRASRTEREGA